MQWPDLLQTASTSLRRNASRSTLTILGIVIGIAAVILMLAIGQSAQGLILSQVSSFGSDLIFIEPAAGGGSAGPPSAFVQQTLKLSDVTALERSGQFTDIAPALAESLPITYGQESKFTTAAGVNEVYLNDFPADMADGRFIEQGDVESYAHVIVLGHDIAKDLFGDQDPLGLTVKMKNISFKVIGVQAVQGSRFFQNLDERVAIPVTTMQREVLGVDYINFIAARASTDIVTAEDEARWVLRGAHHIDSPNGDTSKDDFLVSSQSDAVAIIGVVGTVLTLLLSSIAAISLVVGGIGIMNIMLVSVTERTREIGLRKAIGATRREILLQFLVESVLLTMAGGIAGVALGGGTALLGGFIASHFVSGWNTVVPPIAIILGVGVSTTVGIVFGLYPARRAAALDPIEALRYE